MNPIRAAALAPTSSALRPVADWPRLPSDLKLSIVSGVAVDSRGYVYVAHRGAHPVLRLHPDGTLDREIGAAVMRESLGYDVLNHPEPVAMDVRPWVHGIHVDPWDNLWITDVGRHLVFRFNPAGELTLTLGVDGIPGQDADHFYQPTHVCVLPSGEFYITDGYGNARVMHFDAQARFVRAWGRRGVAPGEFHTPHVITADTNGRLYVSDRENDRIQVFAPNGTLLAVWPELHSVDGLHFAADGFLYGSAGLDNRIIRFATDGTIHEVWGAPQLFAYPHGICIAPDGAIFIAETGGCRVQKLTHA